jgi:integration host factor subunit beta
MTRRILAHQIAEEVGEDIGLTHRILQRVFDGIVETLQKEGRVELRNFGVFQVKRRKPRTARNPRTGEKVQVPARSTVTFKPGREMLERIRQQDAEQTERVEQLPGA